MSTTGTEVVQATAWYGPHHVGGTEIYVEGLVAELARLGVSCRVLVPRAAGATARYVHGGAIVDTFPATEPAEGSGGDTRGASRDLAGFEARIAVHRGAIYHQHSWTSGLGLGHLEAARAAGLRTVLTIHVASALCLRGSMRRFGDAGCAGPLGAERCGACWAHGRGLPRPLADAIARLPATWANRAKLRGGKIATAMAARAHGREKRDQIERMSAAADRIVAVCGWLHAALTRLGVPQQKLVLSRQGVSPDLANALAPGSQDVREEDRPLRLIYVGSFDAAKGLGTVIGAIRRLPTSARVQLTVHAHSRAEHDDAERRARCAAAGDERIVFAGPVARAALAEALAAHDAMVVPSLVLETGPLVVLEAQAAGLTVLGSRLGGIVELAGDDDILIAPGRPAAWADAILRLRQRLARDGALPRRARVVRTMAAVATDMQRVYRAL